MGRVDEGIAPYEGGCSLIRGIYFKSTYNKLGSLCKLPHAGDMRVDEGIDPYEGGCSPHPGYLFQIDIQQTWKPAS